MNKVRIEGFGGRKWSTQKKNSLAQRRASVGWLVDPNSCRGTQYKDTFKEIHGHIKRG